MRRALLTGVALGLSIAASPTATAQPDAYQYVRTESAAVRCVISAGEVACERASADGFPGAPAGQSGGGMNVATVRPDGGFTWSEGNIGDGGSEEVTLTYGRPFSFHGWSVVSSFTGTTVTNASSGHGMSVSIDGVSPF